MTARAHSIEDWATQQALAPIAEAVGHPDVLDAGKLAVIVAVEHERIAALEASRQMLKTKIIPSLEGQVRELTLDRNEWCDRARVAENRNTRLVLALLLALVCIGMGSVVAIGAMTR